MASLCRLVWILIILLGSIVRLQCDGIRWLGLYRYAREKLRERESFDKSECMLAKDRYGLRKKQMLFCTDPKKSYAMHAILKASQAVAYYCPKTFQDRRWNCSSVVHLPKMTPDLKRSTREKAVVHAFASAALLYEVARRCANSKIEHCRCGSDFDYEKDSLGTREQFHYSGCADNIRVAKGYARHFLRYRRFSRGRRRKRSPKMERVMSSHNYLVGIEMMEESKQKTCKCHGVSGSCAQKICFTQLQRIDAPQIQNMLKERYLSSKQVFFSERTFSLMAETFKNGSFVKEPVSNSDLVFNVLSPDYCAYDPNRGSPGTGGRSCHLTDMHTPNHCNNMCCGRGYYSYNKTVIEQCNCRVTPAYQVVCDRCPVTRQKHHCF